MSSIVIARPDTATVEQSNSAVVVKAQSMQVTTKAEHAAGLEMIQLVATGEKRVKELFADSKLASHQAHKAIVAAEKKLLGPLTMARSLLNGKLARTMIPSITSAAGGSSFSLRWTWIRIRSAGVIVDVAGNFYTDLVNCETPSSAWASVDDETACIRFAARSRR